FELYHRDVMKCVKTLYGDPQFSEHLQFAPEKHFLAEEQVMLRVYHDMHTGQWWWKTQEAVENQTPGATIVPIIMSSDKTQITKFRNKSSYPVYITIGNIPKNIRQKLSQHAYMLLAYLPATKLEHITNK